MSDLNIGGIIETCLYAHDLDAAEHFYRRLLGLDVVSREPGRHVFFRCGGQMLLVFEPESTANTPASGPAIPTHGATGQGHVAFFLPPDHMDAVPAFLDARDIPMETEIDWPHGVRSYYFRDPAGNSLEFTTRALWGFST